MLLKIDLIKNATLNNLYFIKNYNAKMLQLAYIDNIYITNLNLLNNTINIPNEIESMIFSFNIDI